MDCRGLVLGMDGWGLGSSAVGGFGFVLERDRLRELMRVAVGLFLGRPAVSADAVGRAGAAVVVPDAVKRHSKLTPWRHPMRSSGLCGVG